MQAGLPEIKPSHTQPLWPLRTTWNAGRLIFYQISVLLTQQLEEDSQEMDHSCTQSPPLQVFWTRSLNLPLLPVSAPMASLAQSSAVFKRRNGVQFCSVRHQAPHCNRGSLSNLFGDESEMWLTCQRFPLHTLSHSGSLIYSSCLADRQQPGMIIGDHNLSKQIPMAFISGCCAFSIIRSQRKSDVMASAFRAGKGREHRIVFRNLEWQGWCLVFR